MKFKYKQTAPCECHVTVEVPAEEVAASLEAVHQDMQKAAALPGFRKGKVPLELIARHYSEAAKKAVTQWLVESSLKQVMQDKQLNVVGSWRIADVTWDDRKGCHFNATAEIEPSVTIGIYQGLGLTHAAAPVEESEIQKALAQLQEAHATAVPTGEGTEKHKQLPALDDEFAKDLGFEHVAALQARVRQELTDHKASQARQQAVQSLIDTLLKGQSFPVPPSLVEQQRRRLEDDAKTRLQMGGLKPEQLDVEVNKLQPQLTTNAERQVRLGFILDRIAEQERIQLTDQELAGYVVRLAGRLNRPVEELARWMHKAELWAGVAQDLRREKTIAWLMQHNTSTNHQAPMTK